MRCGWYSTRPRNTGYSGPRWRGERGWGIFAEVLICDGCRGPFPIQGYAEWSEYREHIKHAARRAKWLEWADMWYCPTCRIAIEADTKGGKHKHDHR